MYEVLRYILPTIFDTDDYQQIMAILQDPVMQSILQQAKSDPAALQDHMKNADIRSKVSSTDSAGTHSLADAS